MPSPRHAEASTARELPPSLPPLRDLPAGFAQRLAVLGGYSTQEKACLGLSMAKVHDEQGELVATVSQECVMAYGEP